MGSVAWRLSGCQTHGKSQDIRKEQGPPPHHAFQPWWIGQACSSQSWPSQPRALPRGSSLPHGEHYLSPVLLAQAGTRALQARGWEGPGLQDSLGPAGLARAQRGGRGSPADRALWACSAALAMWDVILSQPHTLEKVLRELLSKLQDQQLRRMFSSNTEDACIHHLAVSDQTSPCSPSGLCLPLQENRHNPLPSHLPPNSHLLQDIWTQPLRPSTRFPVPAMQGHPMLLGPWCTNTKPRQPVPAQAALCFPPACIPLPCSADWKPGAGQGLGQGQRCGLCTG